MERIYLDCASTTPTDNEIIEKMLPYFADVFGNADSPHASGRKAMAAVDSARDKIAGLLNAKPGEIYFTSGGTEADNWALFSGARALLKDGRTKILVSSIEHHAVLSSAERLKEEGFEVVYIPVNEGGMVEVNTVKTLLDGKVGLVVLMAVNNETGVRQPIEEVAKLCRENSSLFFTDAVQLAPHASIDVKALGVDMLSLSSHKFYGPKGCGVLYIRNGVKTCGFVVGGEQERGLRGGTTNVPLVVGCASAYEKARKEMSASEEKIGALKSLFLQEISKLSGVTVNGDGGAGIVNVRFEGVNGADFVYAMDLKGVSLSVGSACSSASVKPSHVLLAMGRTEAEAKECVRFSFGKNNTEAEILTAARLMEETVKKLRG